MDDLLKKLEAEKELRFKKPWAKLEKGNKLNRLNLYIEQEMKEKELSEDTGKKLKKLLHTIFEKGILSKSSEIEYCNKKGIKTHIVVRELNPELIPNKIKLFPSLVKYDKKNKMTIYEGDRTLNNLKRFIN